MALFSSRRSYRFVSASEPAAEPAAAEPAAAETTVGCGTGKALGLRLANLLSEGRRPLASITTRGTFDHRLGIEYGPNLLCEGAWREGLLQKRIVGLQHTVTNDRVVCVAREIEDLHAGA